MGEFLGVDDGQGMGLGGFDCSGTLIPLKEQKM